MTKRSIETPLGWLLLAQRDGVLCSIEAGRPDMEAEAETPLLCLAREQLLEYFCGSRRSFDLPLAPQGTAFEKAVWRELLQIPYGQTRTYGEIAARLGKPGAARAVGRACAANPLLIVIPCHRVVGNGGKLTGFAAGLEMKRRLLALESES